MNSRQEDVSRGHSEHQEQQQFEPVYQILLITILGAMTQAGLGTCSSRMLWPCCSPALYFECVVASPKPHYP